MEKLTFKNGDTLPMIGLGTWKSAPGEVFKAIHTALRAGYRHFDCAAIYGNEPEIGEAFQKAFTDGLVKREEVWITSKLWNNAHRKEDVRPALKETLRDLQLDYLDLYLVHWPVVLRPGVQYPEKAEDFYSLEEVPIIETWRSMEECLREGLTRHIGVSNFSIAHLEDLLDEASFQPEMNQVELHPYLQQDELLKYCRQKGLFVTAYSPLGSKDRPPRLIRENEPSLLENEVIAGVARKHDCSPAQVLISWAVHRGTAVIPKSVNPQRIRENFAAAEVALTAEDMQQLAALDKGYRFIDGTTWTLDGNPYTLADLWNE